VNAATKDSPGVDAAEDATGPEVAIRIGPRDTSEDPAAAGSDTGRRGGGISRITTIQITGWALFVLIVLLLRHQLDVGARSNWA